MQFHNIINWLIAVPPPNIIIQPISRRIAVLDNVTLICKAEGFEVTYKWRHNGTTANANTSQSGLAITQVVPSDAGHYVCIASTEGGKDVSQRATLTIKGEIMCTVSTVLLKHFHRTTAYSIKLDSG